MPTSGRTPRACAGITAVLVAGAATAAGVDVTVDNEAGLARPGAVVTVPFAQIAPLAPDLRMYHLVVRDPNGRVLPSQVTNYQHDHHGAAYDDLVFSYDFAAGQKRAVFSVQPSTRATPPESPCVYARVVPERFGDMAWENDRIAHRMYGAPLNGPEAQAVGEKLRGSGVDVWGKRVAWPIVDRWYAKGHDQFHRDEEGEGLDLYSIGGSRGDGGTGVWDGGKLWTSDNFASARVLSNGPRRAVFSLTYAPWTAAAKGEYEELKQVTVDCGVNFDAVESSFRFDGDEALIAIGITDHPQPAGYPAPVLTRDPEGRWMSLWEENKDGGLGTAVVLGTDAKPAGYVHDAPDKPTGYGNHLLLVKATHAPLRYFTGTGWNRSGQFADRNAWEAYVKSFAAAVANPLKISVSMHP